MAPVDILSCAPSTFFFFQAEDGIRDKLVTGVQTCALPISDQIFQFRVGQHVGPLQQNPFVAANVRRGDDSFLLDQFGEFLRCALEANSLGHRAQTQHGKNLPSHFEAEFLPPLQILLRVWEGKTEAADELHIHVANRSEEHTSELQSLAYLVCRLLLEKKKKKTIDAICRLIEYNYI